MEQTTREKIVSEYLAGGITYRQLQAKHGVDYRTIHHWVQQFTGKYTSGNNLVEPSTERVLEEPLSREVNQLQAELKKAKLHNELLTSLLDIGKHQYGLDLRKKPGIKRS